MSAPSRTGPLAAQLSSPAARFALFVVYGWFGLLKVIGLSPATGLVQALHESTISFVDFDLFFPAFGAFEVLVGVLFLFPSKTRVALALLVIHLMTTIMPLLVLPSVVWQQAFVPTLEGQYIIKNILIVSAAVTVAGERHRARARTPVALRAVTPEKSERELEPLAGAVASEREALRG